MGVRLAPNCVCLAGGLNVRAASKPKLWTPRDSNTFFGFGTNILVNLI
jgi:hypothetical protein